MKDVANCDTHCELRSSGNQQTVERMLWLDSRQAAPGSVFQSLYVDRSTPTQRCTVDQRSALVDYLDKSDLHRLVA